MRDTGVGEGKRIASARDYRWILRNELRKPRQENEDIDRRTDRNIDREIRERNCSASWP